MSEPGTFYVIDGSSYIYRAYYAIQRLTNARGMATHAVYGFARMLMKVLREHEPAHVCVAFDAPGPTFRHEMYDQYKATRQAMPEDLVEQVPYIKKLVRLMAIPNLEREGVEADDLIATLTRAARDKGLTTVIVSGDKDLFQLVEDPAVRQWDPQRDTVFDEKGVEEKFGVRPGQMLDMLSLMGDSSDNVPGIKGIGEKTAAKLLQEWESLDNLLAHVGDIKAKGTRGKLEEGRDSALLSRNLIRLRDDVEGLPDPEKCVLGEANTSELAIFYEELGFRTLLEELKGQLREAGEEIPEKVKVDREVMVVRTVEELERIAGELGGVERFSVDLETSSVRAVEAKIVGIALSYEDHKAYYVPVRHTGEGSEDQIDRKVALEVLRPLLEADKPLKIGQNLKYEWLVFQGHEIDLKGVGFDTMVADYLLDPGKRAHNLESLALEHLGEPMITYEEVCGKGKSQIPFAEVAVERAAEYSGEDAEVVWRMTPILERKMRNAGVDELFGSLELPLVEVLAAIEHKGVLVDRDRLLDLSIELERMLDRCETEIFKQAGEEFNIASPKQLGVILFEKLGLPIIKKTKTGPSTDMNVLEVLSAEHAIVEEVLRFRSLSKLKGTYVDALPDLINAKTGRIHTSYNQTVAATGRLSSSDPNLQNIPIRGEEGKKIRRAFVAPPGHVLLTFDYSQIELRILAHYSQDAGLLEAFREGADIHRRTAAEMFHVHPTDVSPEMRREAKAINFGIIYGMGPFGLANQLGISQAMAKAAIDRYFARYKGVRTFIDGLIAETKKRGYSVTLLGRRRDIPEINAKNHNQRNQAERLAVNTPIQGTAADLIKLAMIRVHHDMRGRGLKSAMIMQVHDELVFEVPDGELEIMQELVREGMEHVYPLDVPLKVDMGVGTDWMEAHA